MNDNIVRLKRLKTIIRLIFGIYRADDYILLGRKLENIGRGGKWKFNQIGNAYNLEIPNFQNIGDNLKLVHASGITINPKAIIGKNCVLFKNVTIGSVRSGKRKGVPRIGDNCVIAAGAFVCGGITIGDDVLIGANAFVDFNVPSHSLVIGNPGIIHHKDNATKDYIFME